MFTEKREFSIPLVYIWNSSGGVDLLPRGFFQSWSYIWSPLLHFVLCVISMDMHKNCFVGIHSGLKPLVCVFLCATNPQNCAPESRKCKEHQGRNVQKRKERQSLTTVFQRWPPVQLPQSCRTTSWNWSRPFQCRLLLPKVAGRVGSRRKSRVLALCLHAWHWRERRTKDDKHVISCANCWQMSGGSFLSLSNECWGILRRCFSCWSKSL